MNTLGEKLVGLDRKELLDYIRKMRMNIEITPNMTNVQICIQILDYKEKVIPTTFQPFIDEDILSEFGMQKTSQSRAYQDFADFLRNSHPRIGMVSKI